MTEKDDIAIVAEPQMDPKVCNFHVDRPIHNGVVNCTDKKTAEGSPLLEAVFAFDEVEQVMVSGATITVAKKDEGDWQKLARDIGTAIRDAIKDNETLIAADIKDKVPSNEDLKAKVKEVLDEEINPALSSHGGGADLIDVQGTTVFLALSGGCQGCASAKYTLKHGIEQVLRDRVPEVSGVVDVTDHTAGANPYY